MSPLLRAAIFVAILSQFAAATVPDRHVVVRQALSYSDSRIRGAVTSDGRIVAFVSDARLVPDDDNGVADIYVLDRTTQAITLESRAAAGGPANGSSIGPQLTGDGRYLAFESWATNLTVSPDKNEARDVFVRDRSTGTTVRVSVARDGGEANGHSESPAIAGDGTVVAFVSSATNLVPGDDTNGRAADVYVASLSDRRLIRAGIDTAGRQYSSSTAPALSADGRLLAFSAIPHPAQPSSGEVPPRAVYLRDLSASATTCISCADGALGSNRPAFAPDISGDGRILTFTVLSEGPHRTDIAVHDRSSSTTAIITRRANGRSGAPRISGDGRLVVFESWASDLVCPKACAEGAADDNLLPDVYLFDRSGGNVRRVSGARQVWWAPSRMPFVDHRGTTIAFTSRQPFGPEDDTVDFDLYVCSPAC